MGKELRTLAQQNLMQLMISMWFKVFTGHSSVVLSWQDF